MTSATPVIDIALIAGFLPILLAFVPVSLSIFAGASLLGLLGGLLLACVRSYHMPGLSQLAWLVVSYARGVPILVQLMIAYYILPQWLGDWTDTLPPMAFVILALGIYLSANFSEIFRSAMDSLDHAQIEAAQSIGMSTWQAWQRVVLPQTIAAALPDTGNLLLVALKSTSLAFAVGVMDIVGRGQALGAQTLRNFEVYLALAIIYYVLSLGLQWIVRQADRPFARYR